MKLTIEDDILTFTQAEAWPEIHGKSFPIIDDVSTKKEPRIITSQGTYYIGSYTQEKSIDQKNKLYLRPMMSFNNFDQFPSVGHYGTQLQRDETK